MNHMKRTAFERALRDLNQRRARSTEALRIDDLVDLLDQADTYYRWMEDDENERLFEAEHEMPIGWEA